MFSLLWTCHTWHVLQISKQGCQLGYWIHSCPWSQIALMVDNPEYIWPRSLKNSFKSTYKTLKNISHKYSVPVMPSYYMQNSFLFSLKLFRNTFSGLIGGHCMISPKCLYFIIFLSYCKCKQILVSLVSSISRIQYNVLCSPMSELFNLE